MTKEEMDFLSLVFNGFTAIGTVGAVVISLLFSVKKPRRFAVHEIKMVSEKTLNEKKVVTRVDNFLILHVENMLDAPIEIFRVKIGYEMPYKIKKTGRLGGALVFTKEYPVSIPAHNQYDVRFYLNAKTEFGSYRNAKKVTCEIHTSAGNLQVPFPEAWKPALYDALENNSSALAVSEI